MAEAKTDTEARKLTNRALAFLDEWCPKVAYPDPESVVADFKRDAVENFLDAFEAHEEESHA